MDIQYDTKTKKDFYDGSVGQALKWDVIAHIVPLRPLTGTGYALAEKGIDSTFRSKPGHITASTVVVYFDSDGRVVEPATYKTENSPSAVVKNDSTSDEEVYALPNSRKFHSLPTPNHISPSISLCILMFRFLKKPLPSYLVSL